MNSVSWSTLLTMIPIFICRPRKLLIRIFKLGSEKTLTAQLLPISIFPELRSDVVYPNMSIKVIKHLKVIMFPNTESIKKL